MPITGKFVADFASFQDAVQKATVSLKGMETQGNTVSTSLNKMVDQFSGRKIIQEAELMGQTFKLLAEQGIGLTTKELQRMGVVANEAIAKLRAGGEEVPPGIQRIADAANNAQQATSALSAAAGHAKSTFGDLVTQVKATALGFISAEAIIGGVQAGFRALVGFVSGSIQAFAASEAATKKLTAALSAQGLAIPGLNHQYAEMATRFEKTTGFADDLLTEMQALLVEIGDVAPAEMDKALTAATDLAAGLGIDLEQATKLVGKAFAGNTDTFKKYGIVIDEAKLKTEGMTAVLDAIQQKFGGQAAAQVDTYAGRIKELENAWDNLQETVGEFVTQSPIVLAALTALTSAAKNNTIDVGDAGHAWSNFLDALGAPGLATGVRALEILADNANKDAAALREAAEAQRQLNSAMANIERDLAASAANKARMDAVKAIEAQKQAIKDAEAADKAAHEAAMLRGQKAIKFYEDTVKKQKEIETQTKAVNLQMGILVDERLQALGDRGQKILQLMTDESVKFGMAMSGNLPVVEGVANALKVLGDAAQTGIKPIIQLIKTLNQSVDELWKTFQKVTETVTGAESATDSIARAFGPKVGAAMNQFQVVMRDSFQAASGLMRVMAGDFTGMADLIIGGINAIKGAWNLIKDVFNFGGPSREQLLGRKAVEEFHAELEAMLTVAQRAEAGNVAWKQDVIAIRDAYLAAGKSMEEADAATKKLWESSKGGTESAKRAIEEIRKVIGKNTDATEEATAATEEQAQATIETATQAAKALDELGPRLKTNEGEWRSWGDVVTGEIMRIANAVRAMQIPSGSALPSLSGGSTGGIQSSEDARRQGGDTTVIFEVGGEVLARQAVPYIPGAVQRYVAT